jgi:hypothetical protein
VVLRERGRASCHFGRRAIELPVEPGLEHEHGGRVILVEALELAEDDSCTRRTRPALAKREGVGSECREARPETHHPRVPRVDRDRGDGERKLGQEEPETILVRGLDGSGGARFDVRPPLGLLAF